MRAVSSVAYVDDDLDEKIPAAIAAAFRLAGVVTSVHKTAQDLLAHVRAAGVPDLVLADWELGALADGETTERGGDGLELAREIGREFGNRLVMIATRYPGRARERLNRLDPRMKVSVVPKPQRPQAAAKWVTDRLNEAEERLESGPSSPRGDRLAIPLPPGAADLFERPDILGEEPSEESMRSIRKRAYLAIEPWIQEIFVA